MKKRTKRIIQFTAVGLVGVALYIGVPSFRNKFINYNESAAIRFMKNLSSSQAQIQASGENDANRDGAGEYAFLGELMGSIPFLGSGRTIGTPVVGRNKLMPLSEGIYAKDGYFFRMYLPGTSTAGVMEPDHPTEAHLSLVDPKKSCLIWWCVAWPAWQGVTGNRMFTVSQAGDVLSSSNARRRYSGKARIPAIGFSSPPEADEAKPWVPTVNAESRDGSHWHVI